MTSYKKQTISIILLTIFSFSLISVNLALADTQNTANNMITMLGGFSNLPSGGQNEGKIETVIGKIIQAFLSIFGVVFLALMLYGGYVWMKAQGREEEVKRAKSMIQNAIIGLGVVMTAYAISYFVVFMFNRAASTSS